MVIVDDKDQLLVSFTPKRDTGKIFRYLIAAGVSLVVVSMLFFAYDVWFAGKKSTSKNDIPDTPLVIVDKDNLVKDNFFGPEINSEVWDLKGSSGVENLNVKDGKMEFVLNPFKISDIQDSIYLKLLNPLGDSFSVSSDIELKKLLPGVSFIVVVQRNVEDWKNFMEIVIDYKYGGFYVTAVKSIDGELVVVGNKLLEGKSKFNINITKNGRNTAFYVDGKHLGETNSDFPGLTRIVSFMMRANKYENDLGNASVSISNFTVSEK